MPPGGEAKNWDWEWDVRERSNLLLWLLSRGAGGRNSSSCCSEGTYLQQ